MAADFFLNTVNLRISVLPGSLDSLGMVRASTFIFVRAEATCGRPR
jgi:hypothetical protein